MRLTIRADRYSILLALAATGLLAGTAMARPHAVQPTFDRVEKLVMSDVYDTPTFIAGKFLVRARTTDALDVAETFLRDHTSLVGITDPDSELEPIDIIGPDEVGMTHVKFAHREAGLPVFGSELIVHVSGNTVTSVNGVYLPSFRPVLDVRVEGDVAADIAVDYVWDLIDQGLVNGYVAGRDEYLDIDTDPELGFFNRGLISGERTPTRLAWKLSVNAYVVFVSAQTGRILESWDTIHTAMYRELYDANHGTNLPGQLVCREGQACSTNDSNAREVWGEFETIYDYWRNTHGRDSWDGRGSKIIGTVHYSTNFQNAYWNGTQMVFGDDMIALDVTGHELGHGVCQTTANLTYKYQPGALNESLSDVWGAMIDSDDWLIGEDLPIGAVRSMSDPNAYNQPKDMTEYRRMFFRDNGGVHINSGIPNHAAYLLAAGGSDQGISVRPQGRSVVEKIWYRTETTKLTSSAKFADFANAAIRACQELYGNGANECVQTENAFKATKIL